MTDEHLPQRSVGNNSQTTSYIHLPSAPHSRPLATWQEGHTAPVLCEGCNSRANRFGYPTEFKLWYEFVIAQLRIPRVTGHPFRLNPATHSEGFRPPQRELETTLT